jgi:hypothetical protein
MADSTPQQKPPKVLLIPRDNRDTDVVIMSPAGMTRLTVTADGSTIALHPHEGEATHQGLAAAWTVTHGGHPYGWLARKNNRREWFPVRKQRANKRAAKKA